MDEILLAMYLAAVTACGALIIPEKECTYYVYDCLLDGETTQWCLTDYVEGD